MKATTATRGDVMKRLLAALLLTLSMPATADHHDVIES
jgi:hypothetical protein